MQQPFEAPRMDLVVMSTKELSRLEIFGRIVDKRMTQQRAAELLDLTPRQIRRLLRAFRSGGAAGLVSKQRGKRSNRKFPDGLRSRALAIVRERYVDFGPTLASEKLLEAHGIQLSDVNKRDRPSGQGVTQFSRACHELNIEVICANSSQAKGRVERAHLTLQDRLVKKLRLREISTIDAGNAYLMTFRADYNRRFGKLPKSEHDAHGPLRPSDDLDEIFTWQEERKITGDLVVHYKRGMYLLEQTPEALKLRRKLVLVYEREDGTVSLKHKGVTLPFGKFDKDQRVTQAEIVDNKHLGAALAFAQRLQKNATRRRWGREP